MLPFILGGIGLSVLKHFAHDKPREDASRKVRAATQRYSPWTRLQAPEIQEADPIGQTMQFGMAGAQLSQAIDAFNADKMLKSAYTDALNRSHSAPAMSFSSPNPWSLGVNTQLPTPRF